MLVLNKDNYFEYVKETGGVVSPIILSCFQVLKDTDTKIYELVEPLLLKRTKIAQLRPVITRLSYEICGGKDWRKIANICAIMEIHNMYLYFHNWIFDNKNSIWIGDLGNVRKKISDVIIAAAITREIFSDIIDESNIAPEKKLEIEKHFQKSIKETYYGQFLDINLTIDRFKEFKSEKDFLPSYELKSKIQSGSFYSLSGRIGAILAGASKNKEDIISEICELFGTGLHISNDLGDFAPPLERKITFGKSYQDQLADIRENRLTLPVYYVLKYGNEQEKENLLQLVGNYSPTKEQIDSAIKSIHSSGSYEYCHKYIRGYFNRAKKKLHESFEISKERDLFAIMLSVIRTNKFLAELRKYS